MAVSAPETLALLAGGVSRIRMTSCRMGLTPGFRRSRIIDYRGQTRSLPCGVSLHKNFAAITCRNIRAQQINRSRRVARQNPRRPFERLTFRCAARSAGEKSSQSLRIPPDKRGKKRNKPYRTAQQFELLVELIPEPYTSMVYVAIYTGLRVSELAGLRTI